MRGREFLRCPCCTSLRTLDVLDGEAQPAQKLTRQCLGPGRIEWHRQPLPYDVAVRLRDRMRSALAQLEADIDEAERAA